LSRRPRIVLGPTESAKGSRLIRHYRRLGWAIHRVAGGSNVRDLIRRLSPDLVVLDLEAEALESSWLTCAKLTREFPQLRVILVSSRATARDRRMAAFVGAAALVELEGEAIAIG
jgi:DNA-binding response OmpR family regulator